MIFNVAVRKWGGLIRNADAARDAKQYRRAALLYEKALRLRPDNTAIHIQCGHMFKEARDLARAEHHYALAKQLTPDDPDLALQFGHLYKVAGRLQEAELSYRRATELDPDWPEPAIQLAELYRTGWRNRTKQAASVRRGPNPPAYVGLTAPELGRVDAEGRPWLFPIDNGLLPELAPQGPESKLHAHAEEIVIRCLGRKERTHWGIRSTLRGVDAIRGFCISATPIVVLRAALNGLRFYNGALQDFPLKYEKYDQLKRKYVLNIWYDFSRFTEGLHDLQLQFLDEDGGLRVHNEQVVIGSPLPEEQYPNSDGLVSISAADNRSVEEQINSRPSMIRLAGRARFATPPRNVLIQRVDQLGDLIVTIPAMQQAPRASSRREARRFAFACQCGACQYPSSLRRNHRYRFSGR